MRPPRRPPPKWWLAAPVIVVLFIGSTVYSQRLAARLDEDAVSIATNASPSVEALARARGEALRAEIAAATAVDASPADGAAEHRSADEALGRMRRDLAGYLALPFYPGERAHWGDLDAASRAFETELSACFAASAAGRTREARSILVARLRPATEKLDQAIELLTNFNAAEQHQLATEIPRLRRHAAHVAYALDAISGTLAVLLMGFVLGESRRRVRLLADFGDRLEAIAASAVRIAESLRREETPRPVLSAIVEEGARLVDADYAALGYVVAPDRPFDPWVHAGVSEAEVEAIGRLPRPVGTLAAIALGSAALRIDDVTRHPDFRGLPAGHPPMGPFLGVPVRREATSIGTLYLARRPGRAPFTDADEHVVELLASQAAVVADNARLYREARDAVRARDDVLAIVSHDLRSPLAAIRMTAEQIARAAPEGEPGDPSRRAAARLTRVVDGMARLIEDLLAASKIESGTFAIEPKIERVEPLVDEAIQLCRPLAAARSIELRSRVAPALPDVSCDRERVLQVLANLIGNATKFTPDGGAITVVVDTDDQAGRAVRVSVCDTGPGIPDADREHVFDRYWQARHARRAGAGLGLFIVKGIVEAHGGRAWADAAPDGGACLRFTLPAH